MTWEVTHMHEAREEGARGHPPWRWTGKESGDGGPPPLGARVGGYRLEARLGQGGQGTVYRARRQGRLYAIKFLPLGVSEWAWRELEVRLRLRRVGGLALMGHGLWPDERPRYVYIVTPYVGGRPLYDWASHTNPTGRKAAHVMRALVGQVADVHREGVVHRDIKGPNVLVRHADGQPVLVDFGVGTYPGAPEITHPFALPGTRHYRSPEALRFRREHAGEHVPARASDDLWALGVVLYWLLTGSRPFDTDVPDEGVLADLILKKEPEPPHRLNPRVPRALSELCLRMLEKRREARYPSAEALGRELEEVLAEADAAWDVPLCETWSPNDATTPDAMMGWLDYGDWRDKARRLAEYVRHHPRRGRPLPLAEASTVQHTTEPASRVEESRPEPRAPRAGVSARARYAAVAGGVALLAVGGLLALLSPRRAGESSPTPAVVSPPTIPEVGFFGQELASPPKPLEGDWSAAPDWAAIPAPVASATAPEDPPRVKTLQKTLPAQDKKPSEQKGKTFSKAMKAGCTALALGQAACSTPAPQIRPTPMPLECPPHSEDTRKAWELKYQWSPMPLDFPLSDPDDFHVTVVRPGPGATLTLSGFKWGKVPEKTVFLGDLFFGDKRVYGRFTQAQTPDGHAYPVCMELYETLGSDEKGVEKFSGSGRDFARVEAHPYLMPVKSFDTNLGE